MSVSFMCDIMGMNIYFSPTVCEHPVSKSLTLISSVHDSQNVFLKKRKFIHNEAIDTDEMRHY